MGKRHTPLLFNSLDMVVNVASVPQRSPFRYPGGKTWLVPHIRQWLGSLAGRPREFIEPFAGGAIIGLTAAFEDLADRVILVELDEEVASVWRVILNGQGRKLAERIAEFDMNVESVKQVLSSSPRSLGDRAFVTLLRNRVQHGGILAPGASLTKKGENGKGIGSRWYPATLRKRICDIVQVKKRIHFQQGDGLRCIREYGRKKDVAFFIDPPYTIAGRRLYRHSEIDHPALFELVSKISSEFLMTYDDTPEVRKLAEKFDLQVREVAMTGRLNASKMELLIGRNLGWTKN